MLKPWVAQAIFWFVRAGLFAVIAGTIVLAWRLGSVRSKPGPAGAAAIVLLVGLYLAVACAGMVIGHDQVVLFAVPVCLLTFGWILSFRVRSALMMLIHMPMVLGLGLACLFIWTALTPISDPVVPEWEQRVSRNLICRTYPKDEDSLPVTRLMLLRETDDRVKDEIVSDSLANLSPVTCRCTQAANGTVVVMEMRDKAGKVSRKEVTVAGPQGN
ncbi:hypothetical protein [Paludibaculum fermentans]|uniref:Uncharacterized protein n=1 Tax=Paludibaculum fermentans TaxID=1473598 RepID=A0A7S7SP24_PALFE|nr:hypothetical protein [Paludibaculum fermentans]QOY91116.1 hypothetical protein IRI77_14565 [Paludibaculum fermentans]